MKHRVFFLIGNILKHHCVARLNKPSAPCVVDSAHAGMGLFSAHVQTETNLPNRQVCLRFSKTLLISSLLYSATPIAAEAQYFNIPAQSLNNALMRFASSAKLTLIFSADSIRGLNAPALSGTMTAEHALQQLLKDSGFTYRFVDAETVTLQRNSNAPEPRLQPQQNPVTLPSMTVIGSIKRAESETIFAESIDDNPQNYQLTSLSSATRTATPVKQIPQSIQAVKRSLIDDQQNLTVSESLVNVSGVVPRNTLYTPALEGTLLRGFRAEQLLDGFTQYYNPGDRESLVNIERIEVLKGSNAVLYSGGSGAPVGGVINLVAKSPTTKAFAEAGFKMGTQDFYQPYFDWNQPLNDGVLFRVTGEYTDSASHIDNLETHRFNINPSLTLTNHRTTTFRLQSKVSRWQQPDYQGLPATGSLSGNFRLRPQTFIGPSDIDDSHSDADSVWATLDQQLSADWLLNIKARYAYSEFDQKVQTLFGSDGFVADSPLLAPSTWALGNAQLFQQQQEFSFLANLQSQFTLGPSEHTLLLGADYSRLQDAGFIEADFGPLGFGVASVDLTDPRFSEPYRAPQASANNMFVKNTTYGGYLQWQSTLYQRFHQLFSIRLATLEIDYQASNGAAKTAQLKPLPRLGGVFDLNDDISIFASYSEGMRGQPFVNFVDTPLPELSRNIETGFKFDFAGQLSGQLAVYQIERSHVAVTDAADSRLRSVAAGQQRSRGFEADLLWQATDALALLSNYAHTQAQFTDALAGVPSGNQVALVPEDSARIWAHYRFQQPTLQGLSLGLGIYLRSGAFLSNNNAFKTSGYHSLDATIAYETGPFKLATSVKNLSDKHYFQPYNYFAGRVAPSDGIALYVSAALKF